MRLDETVAARAAALGISLCSKSGSPRAQRTLENMIGRGQATDPNNCRGCLPSGTLRPPKTPASARPAGAAAAHAGVASPRSKCQGASQNACVTTLYDDCYYDQTTRQCTDITPEIKAKREQWLQDRVNSRRAEAAALGGQYNQGVHTQQTPRTRRTPRQTPRTAQGVDDDLLEDILAELEKEPLSG